MRRKVIFALPSLEGGGAQRSVLNLVNHLDRTRFDVVLALFQREGPYLDRVSPDIRVVELGARRIRRSLPPLVGLLRRETPAVMVSSLVYPNVAVVAAAALSRFPGITMIRQENNPFGGGRSETLPSRVLTRWAYQRASCVVAVSSGVADATKERYGVSEDRLFLIHNPVDLDAIRTAAADPGSGPECGGNGRVRLIAVGRLVPQKGFDLLIQAVASLREPAIELTILGEGPEEDALRRLAESLGVADRVRLVGFRRNPYACIAKSDLFVLSSRWEGFGHVLTEAMACGTAVLSTRCPSGPDEIVTHGVDGWLCEPESVPALADAIRQLAARPELRGRLAAAASESVNRFDARLIAAEYEALFDRCLRVD